MSGSTRAVVTGGAGVIGRELIALLSAAGVDVLSIDREPLPAGFDFSGRHVQRDLAEGEASDIIAFEPDVIYHLAASFERTVESPDFWPVNWNDNILASHQVVDAAAHIPRLSTFVFASSYLIYSTEQYVTPEPAAQARALRETDRVSTRNLCGGAKYYTEQELRFLTSVARPDVRSVSARIYRVYGRGSRDVVSRWIRALMAGEAIEVFNPENRFDYIFARDVAEGLIHLAGSAEASGPVNLGSGRSRSINEVLAVLEAHFPALRELAARAGSPGPFEGSQADMTRFEQLTGWRPPTALEEGVQLVIDFERARSRSTAAAV